VVQAGDKQKRALDDRADKHYDGFAGPPGQTGNLKDPLEVHRQRDEHQSGENRGDAGERDGKVNPMGAVFHETARNARLSLRQRAHAGDASRQSCPSTRVAFSSSAEMLDAFFEGLTECFIGNATVS
jgi:hypothetical protein